MSNCMFSRLKNEHTDELRTTPFVSVDNQGSMVEGYLQAYGDNTISLTGGAGDIGCSLTRALAEQGAQVFRGAKSRES